MVFRLNRNTDEIFSFYNDSSHNNSTKKLTENVSNHKFLLYSKLCNCLWKPAFYGSALLSLFDGGEYNHLKCAAMLVTSPALVASNVLFGAFWAKLGSPNLLKESWKKSKKETCKKILANDVLGNFYGFYYGHRIASEAYCSLSLAAFDLVGKASPALSKGLETIAITAARMS